MLNLINKLYKYKNFKDDTKMMKVTEQYCYNTNTCAHFLKLYLKNMQSNI
jgi:hypothetical protein